VINAGYYNYRCTVKGQEVYWGNYYNYYWSRIAVPHNNTAIVGYVNDIFISGGGNNQPAGFYTPC
jgi:hypothetical protein